MITAALRSFVFVLLSFYAIVNVSFGQYEATWESLDSRPLPEWYDKAKVGIFLHWGVFSVPSFGSEWFWSSWTGGDSSYVEFMQKNYPPNFTYQDFAKEFTAEFFNPTEWAELFVKAGAKYIVLTSKHHEGFTLWPSKYAYSWNAKDVGPHRDLLGDLADAVRETDLHFGLYHSLLEWYHPLYEYDKANNWNTTLFVDTKIIPEMYELVNTYKPEVLWSDGNWEATDEYWKSKEFLVWLYNESPVKDVIATNDRWGSNTPCTHGGFLSCNDRYNPGVLQPHKWENAMTVDKNSWGYRRNTKYSEILTPSELITTIAQTVSCGGNILINVGPTKEGTIAPIYQERLLEVGEWLGVNGEAIYESDAWTAQNDTVTPGVWYTAKSPIVYATVLNWPENNTLYLGSVVQLLSNADLTLTLLGNEDEPLPYEVLIRDSYDEVEITFPDKASVVSKWAWVIKIAPTDNHKK